MFCYWLLSKYPSINCKTCYSVEHLYNEYEGPFIFLYIDNLLLTEDQKTVKLADFGLAREESLTEMMTAETGTYRWMAPEVYWLIDALSVFLSIFMTIYDWLQWQKLQLYSTVTLRQGEKKHYNHKVDAYSFAIVLWELLHNKVPFEGMSNLQAAYAAAFKVKRSFVYYIFL